VHAVYDTIRYDMQMIRLDHKITHYHKITRLAQDQKLNENLTKTETKHRWT